MMQFQRFTTLRGQIYISCCVLVALCVVTMLIGWWGQQQLLQNFMAYEQTERTSAAVLQIDRKIQELKSRSESYLHTGSESQYRAAVRLQQRLIDDIQAARDDTQPLELGEILEEMRRHVENFQQQLELAAAERKLRTRLVQIELPPKGDQVQAAVIDLQVELNKQSARESLANRQLLDAVQAFAFARKNLLQYINNFRASNFEAMLESMDRAALFAGSVAQPSDPESLHHAQQELLNRLDEFRRLGSRAVHATRGYLFYSNVVLAGEVSEFVYYSDRLKAFVETQKIANHASRQAAVESTRNLGLGASLVAIACAAALATRLSYLIVLPISRITNTFRHLSRGETIDQIPDAARDDEIGRMAQAAMVFSRKNRETSELLQRAHDLTAELADKAQALEISNRELDNFAYVASHDLKSPLRGLNALAQWVQEDCDQLLPDGSRKHLQQMQQRVHKMESLLSDLLEYSRVGRTDLSCESIDLDIVVRSSIELIDNPIGVQICVDSPLPRLVTHRAPLQQVIMNLINNAIKYNDKGAEGWVCVTCQRESEFLRIEVSDNGIGIDPKFHAKVFKMYQRVAVDNADGSGMGLAIVKKQIEGYGGKITIRSKLGEGAVFSFTWPHAIAGLSPLADDFKPASIQCENV